MDLMDQTEYLEERGQMVVQASRGCLEIPVAMGQLDILGCQERWEFLALRDLRVKRVNKV